MRLALLSDLHGQLPPVPPCDLCILAGDLCPDAPVVVREPADGPRADAWQAGWLGLKFRRWLERVPARLGVVAVAGNHDILFEKSPHLVPELPWTYLQDSGATLGGLKFWGSPWQPATWSRWAFGADEARLARQFSFVPDDTDVLVTHGPPHGTGDLAPARRVDPLDDTQWQAPEHAGSRALRDRLLLLPDLKLAVCGHIHSAAGVYPLGPAGLLVNAALLDEQYRLVRRPVLVDLSGDGRCRVAA